MFRTSIIVAIFSMLLYAVFRYFSFMGVFKTFHKHYPGTCKRVQNARIGSEDIAWTTEGLAFITSGTPIPAYEEQIKMANAKPSEILLFDFKNPSSGVTNLTITPSEGFDVSAMRPTGLDVLEDTKKGRHLLYVTNHPHEQSVETVEKFRFDPATRSLEHLKSIEIEGLGFGNDVSLVAEDQFYISNYLIYKSSFVLMLGQNLFPVSTGGIFFYNGSGTVELQSGLVSPNGNCLSKDKKLLYQLTTMEESLLVFRRDTKTNALTLVQKVWLDIKVDNVNLTPAGDALLVGANPCLYRGVFHLISPFDPSVISPTSVLRVPLTKDGLVIEREITEFFYDHGDLISGGSSAVAFDGQMLVGSVINSLVHCQLKLDV